MVFSFSRGGGSGGGWGRRRENTTIFPREGKNLHRTQLLSTMGKNKPLQAGLVLMLADFAVGFSPGAPLEGGRPRQLPPLCTNDVQRMGPTLLHGRNRRQSSGVPLSMARGGDDRGNRSVNQETYQHERLCAADPTGSCFFAPAPKVSHPQRLFVDLLPVA